MKRRTNLFYSAIDDSNNSKFITFSNYTESLTGNFLSTDTKLFPSRFLCLNLKGLNNSNKQSLLNILMSHYENKLAFLRDKLIENNEQTENNIYPLNYLLECLYNISLQNNEWIYMDNITNDYKCPYEIVYISDITEQDYNGTFTDTICTVDLSGKVFVGDIDFEVNDLNSIRINYDDSLECLYGWSKHTMPSMYKDLMPIYDYTTSSLIQYQISSYIKGIYMNEIDLNECEFNMIIPLFDIVDINYKTNFNIISNELYNEKPGIDLINSLENNLYIKNVPYGIWFSGDEPVTIKKDPITGFSVCWSLTLSSQFKPFPYSKLMPNEISQSSKSNAFATFAQVLSNQNKITEKFESLQNQIIGLSNRISNIEAQLKQIGTSDNIDRVHAEMINYESVMNNNFKSFKDEIYDIINNFKWKSTI